MSQSYNLPSGTDKAATALLTKIPDSLEALRTNHSGATAPSSTAAGMFWADTSTGLLKIRNLADNAWSVVGPIDAAFALQMMSAFVVPSLSATTTKSVGIAPRAGTVTRLRFVCDTASTSSSGNEWQFDLTKYPNSAPGSPVELFSANVGTFTSLVGVGGGAETVANQTYDLTPDQNDTLLDGDVLKVTLTAVGSVTTLVNVQGAVEIQ